MDEVIEQARERGRQGVERIMLQTYDQDDIDGLKLIADEVAPNI